MASFIQKAYRPPILAGFGNALLDVHVTGLGEDFLKKFNLELHGQKEVDKEEFIRIASAVPEKNILNRSPGGSVQNTVRIMQWLIGAPGYTTFFGGIGRDDNGRRLEELVRSRGVETRYAFHNVLPTGVAYCFANDNNRSCVACLGATNEYHLADLDRPCIWELLKEVHLVYTEGFFVTHSFPVAQKLVEFCDIQGTNFSINLSACYVCESFSRELAELIKHATFVFGNKPEFLALSRALKWTTSDVAKIILKVHNLAGQCGGKRQSQQLPALFKTGPVVVVTDGQQPVLAMDSTLEAPSEFAVPALDPCVIKDTTGAGDSFVAGFLSGVFADFDLEVCVRLGCWTARQVLAQVGVDVPKGPVQAPDGLSLPFMVPKSERV